MFFAYVVINNKYILKDVLMKKVVAKIFEDWEVSGNEWFRINSRY